MALSAVQRAALAGAVMAGLGLSAALVAESWGGVVPCALCLLERWPYRITVLLGALSFVVGSRPGAGPARIARLLVVAAGLVMLGGAGLGGLHVGVEQGWWPSPLPECQAPRMGGGSIAERLARMPERPAKPCDEPTYLVPGLPLSMAGMNTLLSAILGIGLIAAVSRQHSPISKARP
ncbi:MAG: disulfide bond formation protein B [Janthinobacterium lividum]